MMFNKILPSITFGLFTFFLFMANTWIIERNEEDRIERLGKFNLMGTLSSMSGSAQKKLEQDSCCGLYVLNIWEPWCKPCIEEIPKLNVLRRESPDKNIAFIGITRFSRLALEELEQDHGIRFEWLQLSFREPEDNNPLYIINPTGQKIIPTTIVLDSSGFVLDYLTGFSERNIEKLRQHINSISNP